MSASTASRGTRTASRLSDATVRERNGSAWLVPGDGSRTNHQLRAGWAGPWCTTPGWSPAAPAASRPTASTGWGWRPIGYEDLRPCYEVIEAELPVAGQDWPWGDPHRYPQHARCVGGGGDVFLRERRAGGIEARVGPVAITNGRFGHRPHCICRGFYLQGCEVDAEASPLIAHVEDGVEHRQRARAVAGHSIETPRLLLSATDRHPQGLGDDHDRVGRCLVVQGAPQTAGCFEAEVRTNRAQVPEASTEAGRETRPGAVFTRGWSLQTVGPLPTTAPARTTGR